MGYSVCTPPPHHTHHACTHTQIVFLRIPIQHSLLHGTTWYYPAQSAEFKVYITSYDITNSYKRGHQPALPRLFCPARALESVDVSEWANLWAKKWANNEWKTPRKDHSYTDEVRKRVVSLPDPKPTPARIAFRIARVILAQERTPTSHPQRDRILSALCPHYSRSLSALFPLHLRSLSALFPGISALLPQSFHSLWLCQFKWEDCGRDSEQPKIDVFSYGVVIQYLASV